MTKRRSDGKKIMFISPHIGLGGGIERITAELTTELSKEKEIHLFTFFEINPKHKFNAVYHSLKQNPLLWKPLKFFRIFLRAYQIAKYANKHKINIIVASAGSTYIPAIYSKLFGNKSKIIEWIHNTPEKDLKESFYKRNASFTYKNADKIVTVSKGIAEMIKKKYSVKNVVTIYNAIDYSLIRERSRESIDKTYIEALKNAFVFINIGRLVIQKGQWFLIRAFKKVTEKYANARLIILGDGTLRKELEELIRKTGQEQNILLLGLQENPYKFLKRADCFVFSSLWEGLPISLIEASALGLPIIAADCKSGPREILAPTLTIDQKIEYPYLGKYGILVKPFPRKKIMKSLEEEALIKEEEMLAEMMKRIIEDSRLRNKYKTCERGKEFDIKNIAEKWKKLIESL